MSRRWAIVMLGGTFVVADCAHGASTTPSSDEEGTPNETAAGVLDAASPPNASRPVGSSSIGTTPPKEPAVSPTTSPDVRPGPAPTDSPPTDSPPTDSPPSRAPGDGGIDPAPAPLPVLDSVTPSVISAGSSNVVLVVRGRDFVSRSLVYFGGAALPTTFANGSELTAQPPSHLLKEGGTYAVVVRSPPPGGGRSRAVDVEVREPRPELLSLSPKSAVEGSSSVAVVLRGRGFEQSALVYVDAASFPAVRVSEEELHVLLPASTLAAPGPRAISVVNFGGDPSASLVFEVVARPPP